MDKIKLNNLSIAHTAKGHGVASVYDEQVGLMKDKSKLFEVQENQNWKQADINIIHTINLKNRKPSRYKKIPSLTFCHFLPQTLKGSIKLGLITPLFKRYVKKFYKKSQNLIVVNQQMIPDLIKMGCKEDRLHVVPNSISTKRFFKQPKAKRDAFRKKLGFTDKDFVLISTGQVQERKGVDEWLEVAKQFEDTHPNLKFMWVGGFSFKISAGRKKFQKIMDNPPKNVIFAGMVDREEINDYYNASDALFFPSRDETFGMSIIEAMAVGLPTILNDLEPYKLTFTGKYLVANNTEGYVENIKKVLNKEEWNKWSKKSTECVSKYTEDAALKHWETLLMSVYKKHKDKRK